MVFNQQDFTDTMRDIRENYYVSPTMRKCAADYARQQEGAAWGDWRDGKITLSRRLDIQEWAAERIQEAETRGNM